MNNLDADYIRRTTDLLSLVGNTHLRKVGANWYAGPCPFCGGRDRFVLKFTLTGWRWLCRHCTDGKYLDAVDYVMRRDGVDFKEAVERLGGGKPVSPLRIDDLPPLVQKAKPEPQDPQTVERLTKTAYEASSCIDGNSPLAAQVRAYLHSRGFIEPTIQRALLGATKAFDARAGRKRPAVSIPYFDTALNVRAIKYRFADDEPDGLRYVMEKGSQSGFYYLPEHLGYCDFLLVVEGELNLLSVAQVKPELDLASTASQSLSETMRQDLSRLAAKYKKVWVWFDAPQKAKEVALLVTKGIPVQSPVIDGRKMDANAILQTDQLHEFITHLMGVPCHGWRLTQWRAQYETQGVGNG